MDDGTHPHNTLSAANTAVQVFYPFHPLHGATLQILRRPKRGDGAVCVMDPAGRRLKIPVWMLLPECAGIRISRRPHLGKEALLSLASLIASQLASKDGVDAKANGVKFGRKPILTPHQQQEARKRLEAGETQRSVARSYNVSQSTISWLG